MLKSIILRNGERDGWLLFEHPDRIVVAREADEIPAVLDALDDVHAKGDGFAAGFVCYEAAPAFDTALTAHPPGILPLACFGLFRRAEQLTELPVSPGPVEAAPGWNPVSGRDVYESAIAEIKRQIELGNTYQVNFTVRLQSPEVKDAWSLFRRVSLDAPYAAWVDLGDSAIVSASPELFFELNGTDIVCRPMKGTAKRGVTTAEDRRIAGELAASVKNRAENVMITDMIRNDLGRIANPGSVRVDALYSMEKYPTVWQMTSTVSAKTGASPGSVLRALFPCASVTGAPKASSMSIIARLEDTPREIYTGTIGYVGPGRRACFNVAIRTALVDTRQDRASYGVGGGIVWDSDPRDEYAECLAKASVLGAGGPGKAFELLETLLWTADGGFYLLGHHMDRMRDSAAYFDYPFPESDILRALDEAVARHTAERLRVRLLLGRRGNIAVESSAPADQGKPALPVIGIAKQPIDARDPFLYHKTTHREVYEQALRDRPGVDDVILWNSEGFITETTIANIVVRFGDRLYTPPLQHGLLGGTLRRQLLETGKIEERPIRVDDLGRIDELRLINSVRGSYPGLLNTD